MMNFWKCFGLHNIKELPTLPRYKLDSNRQVVIDEIEPEPKKEIEEENKEQIKSEESEGEI